MENNVVRFGIIGLGVGASRAKIAANTPGSKLICVCDLKEEHASKIAMEYGCDWTTDYESMIARDDIDAIGIFTPSGTHADFAIAAIQSGKHAFTTKPMDILVDKCDAVIEAAQTAGKIFAVDFGQRYSSVNQKTYLAIQSGRLGTIILGDLRMKWYREQSYYDGGSPPGWRSKKQTEGGSAANQGVHSIDLFQWFLGPVHSVYGKRGTFTHEISTEDCSVGLIEFQNGAFGVIQTTTSNFPSLGTVIEITGSNGTLSWKDAKVQLYKCKDDEDASLDEFQIHEDRPRNIIEDVVSAITKGTPVAVDGIEGRKSVEIFCAIYKSSRTGKSVVLST